MSYVGYNNGNYKVIINKQNGSKFRIGSNFAPSFAESMDMTITTKCDGGCSFCYMDCSLQGNHCDFYKYKNLLNSILPYTEVAINGNDLSHPELESFLLKMKERNIFVNMTVNQYHYLQKKDIIDKYRPLLNGLGISYVEYDERLKNIDDNTVIHVVAGNINENDLHDLEKLGIKKLLILGYKKKGRGKNFYLCNKEVIDNNIKMLSNYNLKFDIVAYDNLALEQLNVKQKVSNEEWEKYYMGDEGTFTFFVDLVNDVFAKSSTEEIYYPIAGKTTKEMFDFLRSM